MITDEMDILITKLNLSITEYKNNNDKKNKDIMSKLFNEFCDECRDVENTLTNLLSRVDKRYKKCYDDYMGSLGKETNE